MNKKMISIIAIISLVSIGLLIAVGINSSEDPEEETYEVTDPEDRNFDWWEDAGTRELSDILKNENEPVIDRRKAAFYLGEKGDSKAVDVLTSSLTDNDWLIRKNAAMSLGKIKDPDAVESLRSALNDEVLAVRAEAACALGEIGTYRASEAHDQFVDDVDLSEVLQDYSSYIKDAEDYTLKKEGSEPLLILLLQTHDDRTYYVDGNYISFRDVVEDLRNSYALRLNEKAREWAKDHGCSIEITPTSKNDNVPPADLNEDGSIDSDDILKMMKTFNNFFELNIKTMLDKAGILYDEDGNIITTNMMEQLRENLTVNEFYELLDSMKESKKLQAIVESTMKEALNV